MLRLLLSSVLLLTAVTSCQAQVDATIQPETKGSDVVDAVVNVIKASCIFNEDRQFLRRLAYVESRDGMATSTYRPGFDGGIWQVPQSMFEATKTCYAVLRPVCDIIKQSFNIDWTRVTWSDLRKPLYSGLAATLYLIQHAGNSSFVPGSIESQRNLWANSYHFGTPPDTNFTYLAQQATEYTCNDNVDLTFIIDGSGSIVPSDFQLSLNFIAQVVSELNVPNFVRVAAINFDSTPTVEFYFTSYSNKSAVLSAIHNIRQVGGGTGTDMALDLAQHQVFSTAYGARPTDSTKRVAILITDGQSANPFLTTQAAQRLRDQSGVTVFAIGVGGYDLKELRSVASSPPCSYVYTLSDFSVIHSIINEIERSVCKAHNTLTSNGTITVNSNHSVSVIPPTNGTTVVDVTCGIANVYISYTNPNPNPALYTEKFTATDGHPAYLTTAGIHDGQQVYMTVIGSKLPESVSGLNNCTDFRYQISTIPRTTQVMCCNEGHCHECTPTELRQDHRIREIVCSSPEEFRNPCNVESMGGGHTIFPYPYDPSKFIKCDFAGNPYVTLCPNRQTFNVATLTCGFTTSTGPGGHILPANYPNPCTPEHIAAQYFFFEYTPDRSKYIHCDLWGNAFLEQCPVQQVWSQANTVCVEDRPSQPTATTHRPVVNPCTPAALAAGHYFFPYPCDHTRYIHCDISGIYWVQFCPASMFFNPSTSTCATEDPQLGQHGCD